MKLNILSLLVLFTALLLGMDVCGQYGYGNGYGGGGYGYGRQRSAIPQAQETPKEPEPKTAEQIVDEGMPSIIEAIDLNEFEAAVMSSVLKKYLKERIEMQILKLSPEKMREGYNKITERQDEELKAGLPLDKYEAFVEMQKNGIDKTKRKNKKEKRKKRKKTKD